MSALQLVEPRLERETAAQTAARLRLSELLAWVRRAIWAEYQLELEQRESARLRALLAERGLL